MRIMYEIQNFECVRSGSAIMGRSEGFGILRVSAIRAVGTTEWTVKTQKPDDVRLRAKDVLAP